MTKPLSGTKARAQSAANRSKPMLACLFWPAKHQSIYRLHPQEYLPIHITLSRRKRVWRYW